MKGYAAAHSFVPSAQLLGAHLRPSCHPQPSGLLLFSLPSPFRLIAPQAPLETRAASRPFDLQLPKPFSSRWAKGRIVVQWCGSLVLYSTWSLMGLTAPNTTVNGSEVDRGWMPSDCQCTVHGRLLGGWLVVSRTVREKHKTSDDVCQARHGGGVFPACLAARSFSVARRSYLSAGLYLLVRVSIPGPVRGRGWRGPPSRAWLFPRGADHSRAPCVVH